MSPRVSLCRDYQQLEQFALMMLMPSAPSARDRLPRPGARPCPESQLPSRGSTLPQMDFAALVNRVLGHTHTLRHLDRPPAVPYCALEGRHEPVQAVKINYPEAG